MKDPRTEDVAQGLRRLQVGLSSAIVRGDGAVVEVFPGGSEVVLVEPGGPNPEAKERQVQSSQEHST